jgi:hypothetical protein
MRHIVFLLEEPSARDLLQGLLPRLLPDDVQPFFLVFEGKQDLERELVRKMRAWRRPDSAFVVLRDQDAGDCVLVKRGLVALVNESGRSPWLVRVACRELESWILGDWHAVAQAFDSPRLAQLSARRQFKEPDRLVRPVDELRRHVPGYQKRDGARRVGPLLDPARNHSHSFKAMCSGIRRILAEMDAASQGTPQR